MVHTVQGNEIDPFRFKGEDITLEELAHALACQNRFLGHAAFPISIAQHAVNVSCLAHGHEMQGLHHDDSEAIIGDVNKWLKQTPTFSSYRELEDIIQTEFYRKFGCPDLMAKKVQEADRFAVRCEMYFGFGKNFCTPHPGYETPTDVEIDVFLTLTKFQPIDWKQAEQLYLERHSWCLQRRVVGRCV